MIFLNATINNLNQTILYHQQQIEETQNQLDQIKVSASYGEEAVSSVEDAIANINSEHLDLLREHLLSLFEDRLNIFVEEKEPSQEIIEDQAIESHKEITSQPSEFEEITPEIIYNHQNNLAYIGGKNKGRLENYGVYLTKILNIGESYTISKKPSFVKNYKYEMRVDASFEDAKHLAKFTLKSEWNSSVNKDARSLWCNSRKREVPPACKPNPKLMPLEEIKLGDIVYLQKC